MERIYLLPQEGQFYKANLHSHTTVSDGDWTPEVSKKMHMEHGYSIVAYTDHCKYVYHKDLMSDDFIALAAYEVDIPGPPKEGCHWSTAKTYHINLFDKNPEENAEEKAKSELPEQRYGDFDYINGYVEKMKQKGFIACYNHPYWSMQDYDDYKGLKGFFAMEIYNHGCELEGLYGYHPQSYDELLRLGNKMFCMSTDDNHNRYPVGDPNCDSFGGFTMIKSKELTYAAIMEALEKGTFYSSMGPEIKELYIEDQKLVIKTSPVDKIVVLQEGRNCYNKFAKEGETITEAVFELQGHEGYIRVDCKDGKGLHANSNAYFLSDLGISFKK